MTKVSMASSAEGGKKTKEGFLGEVSREAYQVGPKLRF